MAVYKEGPPSVKNIWILITTLAMAVLMSFLFIKVIVLLDLKDYLGLVVPLLPVFYTIIYPILDRPFSSSRQIRKVRQAGSAPIEIVTPSYFRNLSFWKIAGGIFIALAIKFLMEVSQYVMILFLSNGSFANIWMGMDPSFLFRIFKGDLVDSHLSMLFLEMILMSCAGGIWIGYCSKTRPIMEGIIAGTLLSIIIAYTNITPLYGKIKQMTSQLTGLTSQKIPLEHLSGVLAFTFLFSCWVLLGLKLKAAGRK